MSTIDRWEPVGTDQEPSDSVERMPRRSASPMPVHRSAAAIRAASRSNGRTAGRPKRSRRSAASCRRMRRAPA